MNAQDFYIILPYEILGLGSMLLLLAGAFVPSLGKKALNGAGAAIALAAAATAALYSPPASVPAAGMIQADGLGRSFTFLSSTAAFIVLLFSMGYTARRPLGNEEFPSTLLFAAFGMSVLASSVSLLGVFLGLECMSLALYILLASNRADRLSGEAGLKYLIVGAISTAFFAYGLSLIYAATGTLSLSGAMRALTSNGAINPLGLAGWGMLLVGLGFKASLFPFHFWAPDVYEGGPSPVVAFLSTASKAAVFAVFLRLALLSAPGWGSIAPVLWASAVLTMAFGNIAALTQNNVKRLLAYSSVAQMGYVLTALIAAPETGASAAVFYLAAYTAMELGAFGVVSTFSGRDADLGSVEALRGLGFVYPFRSFVLAVSMVSLAGLPPTAGFIGKFGVFHAAFKAGYVWLAVIGILTAIVSVYYYLRVVVYLYMRHDAEMETAPGHPVMPRLDFASHTALGIVVVITIYLGIFPGGLLDLIAAFI